MSAFLVVPQVKSFDVQERNAIGIHFDLGFASW